MKTAFVVLALALVACGSSADDEQAQVAGDRTEPATIYLKLGPPVGEPQPAPTPTYAGPTPTTTSTTPIPCYACLGH